MKRLTHEFVKQQFEKSGYKFLSEEYINSKTKNLVECPLGHQFYIRYNSFNQGSRCPICYNNNIRGKHQIPSYEQRKFLFEKYNWKLLSKEYINSSTKLLVECDKGHKIEITYNSFNMGCRCPICFGNQKLEHEFVNIQHKNFGYKLKTEYINSSTKNLVECPKGHQYYVTFNHFQQGKRCPVCYNKIRSKNQKHDYKFIKQQYEKYEHKLKSKTYKNALTKLLVECPKGHLFLSCYNDFQQGRRCPVCWGLANHSRSEKDCLNVVKQIIPNEIIIENDRTQIINPKTNQFLELDIYIPSLNKAIEFNGEHWHKSEYSKYKDNQKIEQCKEKNINLVTIWYQNWVDNKEEQINKIERFLK